LLTRWQDWITKNKDPLQEDIMKAIIASKKPFFANLFTDPDLDPRERMAQAKVTRALPPSVAPHPPH
jgi:myosin heavy subunit